SNGRDWRPIIEAPSAAELALSERSESNGCGTVFLAALCVATRRPPASFCLPTALPGHRPLRASELALSASNLLVTPSTPVHPEQARGSECAKGASKDPEDAYVVNAAPRRSHETAGRGGPPCRPMLAKGGAQKKAVAIAL